MLSQLEPVENLVEFGITNIQIKIGITKI